MNNISIHNVYEKETLTQKIIDLKISFLKCVQYYTAALIEVNDEDHSLLIWKSNPENQYSSGIEKICIQRIKIRQWKQTCTKKEQENIQITRTKKQ